VYPNPEVASLIIEAFVPVRQHVRDHPEVMEQYGVHWTPAILVLDEDGKERRRIEGFLEAEPLVAQLRLGLGMVAFARARWDEAERIFERVAKSGDPDAAPEAAYWAGVARYKKSRDPADLAATWKRLHEEFPGATWEKRASIWK
jgi:hypothetical protein